MACLFRGSRRLGVALAMALGLTLLSAITRPLFSDRVVATLLPGTDVVLADEVSSGGG